jgi:peptidoglycan/LPS O-acetylase OafA/YrhL
MAQRYNPTLDGIRGLAIIAVLLTHGKFLFLSTHATKWFVGPLVFGWSGVDLFFVLSGFLITGILLETRAASNRARSFYGRRFLRIFPIYYLTLLVVFGAGTLYPRLGTALHFPGWQGWAAHFLYLQNYLGSPISTQHPPIALGHFWSLAVEEQFYLLWPLLIWSFPPRLMLKICIAGAACALLLRIFLVYHFGPHIWIHKLTMTRGEGLLVGSALAILAANGRRISPRLLAGMAVAGTGAILFIMLVDRREFLNTDAGPYMYTLGVSGLGLAFGALVGSSQYSVPGLTRLLNARILKSFGKYSYGIYVFHIPILTCAHKAMDRAGIHPPFPALYAFAWLAALMAVSFGVAWVSYELIESKFLRMKRRFEPVYAPVEEERPSPVGSVSS